MKNEQQTDPFSVVDLIVSSLNFTHPKPNACFESCFTQKIRELRRFAEKAFCYTSNLSNMSGERI